jgi:hypothetical protein
MSKYEAGTFRCTVCAKEFLSKNEADRHSEVHSNEKTNVMVIMRIILFLPFLFKPKL